MAERSPSSGGLQIGRMSIRVPGGTRQDGARIASHLQASLGASGLGPAGDLPQVRLRVTVGHGAGPELVAQSIARALRGRLG
ncbi:hypothetical protein [Paraliomyxa miuraensis]|uniref:hypothetical protein n=1 Tax=Paraliomyxa miuraensis TaxID=376150 RepID=UPI00225570FD|nr:hypothetical protein [Paraliomyxa miuraensis]MCX4247468.1 hypothetical protein [Paraliomyxa miuraensis]